MSLTPELAEEIKKQLLIEIDKLPNENKEQIKIYIKSLNEQELEDFLKRNKIKYTEKEAQENKTDKCVFCQIIQKEIDSYPIAESKKNLAVLEINPLSKGHSLVIPFEHSEIEKIPKTSFSLAQKIAKKIKSKLKPTDIRIETSRILKHPIIKIIPIYENTPLKSYRASDQELKEIQNKLKIKKRKKKEKIEKESPPESEKIKFRIP